MAGYGMALIIRTTWDVLANQTPKGLLASLFVKTMTIGIPFCDQTDEASLFVKKIGMASLFVKSPKLKSDVPTRGVV